MNKIEALENRVRKAVLLINELTEENSKLKLALKEQTVLAKTWETKNKKFENMEADFKEMKEKQRLIKRRLKDLLKKVKKYQ